MKTTFLSFFILLISGYSFAQIGESNYDPRVKKSLDAIGLKYTITDNGNFKLIFDMNDDRTQMVLIRSKTYDYEGMEVREITSIAAITKSKEDFSQEVLFSLLERNGTYKLGAWQIDGGESPYVLEFGLRISANSTNSTIDNLVRLAAKVADEMEEKLTDEDKH